jgi:hypothetical protein
MLLEATMCALARHHFRSFRNQNFGQWPFGYGYGYGDESPYAYDYSMAYPTPQTVVKPDPQVRCQHSEQTRKVPSAKVGPQRLLFYVVRKSHQWPASRRVHLDS